MPHPSARPSPSHLYARRVLATALACALLVVLGAAAQATEPLSPSPVEAAPPAGRLMLIGGNMGENRAILSTFVRLADPDGDGPMRANIAVVTASSYPAQTEEEATDPEEENATTNGLYYVELFERFGADAWPVPIDEADNYPGDPYVPDNADDPDTVRRRRP